MRRRNRRSTPEEHENHDRWLVSYADFITLLFAFFVVMYALSSLNEGKYRVLSNSLVTAFRSAESTGGGPMILPNPQLTSIRPSLRPKTTAQQAREAQAERMKKVATDVTQVMSPYATQGQVAVIETERGDHGRDQRQPVVFARSRRTRAGGRAGYPGGWGGFCDDRFSGDHRRSYR